MANKINCFDYSFSHKTLIEGGKKKEEKQVMEKEART